MRIFLRHSKKKGFAMVEAIIAMSMLLVASVAFFTLMVNSSRFVETNAEQFTATHLAVEGIELVKYMIEQNYAHHVDWVKDTDRNGCYEFDYTVDHDRDKLFKQVADDFSPPQGFKKDCTLFGRLEEFDGDNPSTPDEYSFLQYTDLPFMKISRNPPGVSRSRFIAIPGYSYYGQKITPFKRMIAIDKIDPSFLPENYVSDSLSGCKDSGLGDRCKMRIKSVVGWKTRMGEVKYVELETIVYDWRVWECSDYKDNDGDAMLPTGGIDYNGPTADPDCLDKYDNDELS